MHIGLRNFHGLQPIEEVLLGLHSLVGMRANHERVTGALTAFLREQRKCGRLAAEVGIPVDFELDQLIIG